MFKRCLFTLVVLGWAGVAHAWEASALITNRMPGPIAYWVDRNPVRLLAPSARVLVSGVNIMWDDGHGQQNARMQPIVSGQNCHFEFGGDGFVVLNPD